MGANYKRRDCRETADNVLTRANEMEWAVLAGSSLSQETNCWLVTRFISIVMVNTIQYGT